MKMQEQVESKEKVTFILKKSNGEVQITQKTTKGGNK